MEPFDEGFTVHPHLARRILAAQSEDAPDMTYQEALKFWGMGEGDGQQQTTGLPAAGFADGN